MQSYATGFHRNYIALSLVLDTSIITHICYFLKPLISLHKKMNSHEGGGNEYFENKNTSFTQKIYISRGKCGQTFD